MTDAAAAVGDQTASAVLDEAAAREGGTSAEDLAAYGEIAGAVAMAGACAAVGAGLAAPVCAWIGGEVGGWLTETVGGWFMGDDELEAAIARRQQIRARFARQDACNRMGLATGEEFVRLLDELRALHAELFPAEQPWRSDRLGVQDAQRSYRPAMLLMADMGLELESREGPEGITLGLPSLDAYWHEVVGLGADSERALELCETRATGILEQMQRAYNLAVLALTARAAGERAVEQARRPDVRDIIRRPIVRQIGAELVRRPAAEVLPAERADERAAIHARTRRTPPVPDAQRSWTGGGWRIGAALTGAAGLLAAVRVLA